MAIKAIVDKLDDVPEHFRELYTERNGKFEITGIEGMKTAADVERVQVSLQKERKDHKELKERYSAIADLDVAEIVEKLDKYPELETAAKGKIDDAKINEMVEARIKTKLGPVERELNKAKTELAQKDGLISEFQKEKTQRIIYDSVREAATKMKVEPTAVDDALILAERMFEVTEEGTVVTRDKVGVSPGLNPEDWLRDMQPKRPHWWPVSSGGGSRGNNGAGINGGGPNPFSGKDWNLTEQGRIINTDRKRAEKLASAAGTTIGGHRPVAEK